MPHNIFEINFLKSVKELISEGDSILLAYSGGLDSTCLLYLLSKFSRTLKIRVAAFYLNHGIRSKAAIEKEMALIKKNCEKYGAPLYLESADIVSAAKKSKRSVEEEARDRRYILLLKKMSEEGFSKAATAHHLDDSAETLVLKLLKGGSPSSLAGIKDIYKGCVIRPLLFASKEDIKKYARENRLVHSTDSTNKDVKYERNFVRRKIIPALKKFSPNFLEKISNFQNIQKTENNFIDSEAKKLVNKNFCFDGDMSCSFNGSGLASVHPAVKNRAVLYAIKKLGFDPAEINFGSLGMIVKFAEGKGREQFEIQKGRLYIYRSCLYDPAKRFKKIQEKIVITRRPLSANFSPGDKTSFEIPSGKEIEITINRFKFIFKLEKYSENKTSLNREKYSIFIIFEPGIKIPLVIRSLVSGDRMKTAGMKGLSQKVSDILSNEKVPAEIRNSIPVICGADGEVLAVCDIKFSEKASTFKPDVNYKPWSYLLSGSFIKNL
ncbi:MAG TPA: tRNA lysidine(34) synthetase TilS [Candidatus Wallbacteria bacterium]|nr:tRNA lysidine(34) synthetase TilS [Candidatus Wallbacteria bacterium]